MDHVPLEITVVAGSCMAVPSLNILSVTSPLPSCARPVKVGAWLLLTLPLSGLVIVTTGGAAMAVPTGPTAIATSATAVVRKRALAVLLIESCSQPCDARPLFSSQAYRVSGSRSMSSVEGVPSTRTLGQVRNQRCAGLPL